MTVKYRFDIKLKSGEVVTLTTQGEDTILKELGVILGLPEWDRTLLTIPKRSIEYVYIERKDNHDSEGAD